MLKLLLNSLLLVKKLKYFRFEATSDADDIGLFLMIGFRSVLFSFVSDLFINWLKLIVA